MKQSDLHYIANVVVKTLMAEDVVLLIHAIEQAPNLLVAELEEIED